MEGEFGGDPQPATCPAQGWWVHCRGWAVSLALTPAPVPSLREPLFGEGAHPPPTGGLCAGPPGGTGTG